MTLEQLRALLATLMKEMRAIVDGAGAAQRTALTADEQRAYDEKRAKVDEVKASITRLEDLEAQERALAAAPPVVPAAAPVTNGVRTGRLEVGADLRTQDPQRGFRDHREFLGSVLRASQGRIDERLRALRAVGSDEANTFDNSAGGFLVPTGFTPGFMTTPAPADPIIGRTTVIPMEAPTVLINYRVDKNHTDSVSGGIRVTRRAEAETKGGSHVQTSQFGLQAHSLWGIAYATEEVLRDSAVSFLALIEQGFRDESSSVLVQERLNGTGVGEYLGIHNSPAMITVAKESNQAADTILFANLAKMRSRCWGYQDAVWMANHDCLPQLMTLQDASGNAMWQQSAREGEPDRIFGRPLVITEYCETVGDQGDILLVNWTQYIEGILQQAETAESMHVRFEAGERCFRFWLRNGGMPWWDAPLTPKKGQTLSPYVRLAVR